MPPLQICKDSGTSSPFTKESPIIRCVGGVDGVKFWCSTLAILSGWIGKPLISGCRAGRGIGRIAGTDWGCRVLSSAGGRDISVSLDVGGARGTSSVGIETLRGSWKLS